MKRFLALAALVLGLASCQTEPEGLNVNVGGEVDTTITVTIPETETRYDAESNSAKSVFENGVLSGYATMRYIFQVYYNNNGEVVESQAEPQVKYSDDKTVNFDVRLVPDRNYTFVVWADVVDGENAGDKHYNTLNDEGKINLRNITVKENSWVAMDESRDAFTVTKVIEQYNGQMGINLELKRALAKLRVITTDMKALNDLQITPAYAKVEYTTAYRKGFNAVTGMAVEAEENGDKKTHTFQIAAYGDNGDNSVKKVLFTDYFFAANNQDDEVNFVLSVYENANEQGLIKSNPFNTAIPARRNYLTTIQGNILTDGNNVKVDVQDAFVNVDNNGNTTDPNYEYKTISSAKEFLAALKTAGKYIVISDLHIAKAGDTITTLATRAGGATTTIDLNGKTITVENKGTDALASVAAGNTLVITNTVDGGKIELTEGSTGAFIENNGTVVIENGNIKSNSTNDAPVIDNNGTTNITGGVIGDNAVENTENGDVNITGGEFKDDDLSDFVPDGYDVEENEDGSYTVTESEPVAQIGNETYTTLQAAFDAVVGEATITLLRDATFKNTSVLAEGKTATLDLNGFAISHSDIENKYALNNHGTLTIKDSKGNGSINSRGIYNGYGNGGENVTTAKLTIVKGIFNAKGTNGGAAVFNYGTVDVQGGEFTSIGGYSFNNQSGASMTIANGVTANNGVYATGATLTINGGEISGNRSGCHVIYANNSTVTINGGTLYNNNSGNSTVMAAGTTKITYNGGTYGIKDGRVPGNGNTWTSCLLDSQNSAEVVVNDGTYNGGFRVQAGTSMTINGGSFNDCYGSNYNIYGTVTIKGGTYTDAAAIAFAVKYVAEGYMAVDNGDNTSTVIMPAAKVGNTIYTSIEDAIANWTNNTTLTLKSNVELSDVITLNSTEHHILDLGTYTMTAASDKNAFEIIAKGTGASERTAITIKADANNPGCINAGSKSVVYYNYANGTATGDDRPIIKIEGGIFRGATSSFGSTAGIYFKGGSAARQAATLNISGGEFHCSINGQSKSKLLISGGLFHYSVGSQGDSTALRLISGGTFKTLGFMTADSNNTKFWFGTSMGNSNVGVYVDKDDYLVVGGPVITEAPGENWEKKSYSSWSSYLKYSSAATYGLFYEPK